MPHNDSVYTLSDAQRSLLHSSTPTIDIFDEVDEKMFLYVREAIMYLRARSCPDIHIVISSPGGHTDSGLDIYDLLRLYPGKKTAVIHDKAASMGAIILQACNVRQCAAHSSILIHHISRRNVTLDTLRNKKLLEKMIEKMEENQHLQYKILSIRSGRTIAEIKRECAKNQFMSATQALAFGLIDEIV